MDLKYVARQLLRRPGHTLAVIACLVIGLVASVGTFSVITSLFYGDMPGIAGRRSLARIFLRYDSPTGSESGGGGRRIVTAPLSFNDFAIMRELPADSALDAIGAEGDLRMTAAGSHGPVSISGAFVSGDFFRVLRTTPLRGRFLSPDDDRPAAAPVAVVTEYFWRTHLDGRDDAIGRPVLLGGNSFTVVGVAPPRFHGLQTLDPGQDDSNGVQAWIPLALAPQWPTGPSLDTGWLNVVGRVKAGLTITDVERQLTVSAARIAASQPTTRANAAPRVRAHGSPPNDTPDRDLRDRDRVAGAAAHRARDRLRERGQPAPGPRRGTVARARRSAGARGDPRPARAIAHPRDARARADRRRSVDRAHPPDPRTGCRPWCRCS